MRLSPDQIFDVLMVFREHLEPCWCRFHSDGWRSYPLQFGGGVPSTPSALTCQETSAFLLRQLTELGVEDVQLCGGMMRHAQPLEGDCLHEHGKKDASDVSRRNVDEEGFVWEPHFWLEHNGLVIDITKDQFGWDHSDIHEVETAELIYWKEEGAFPQSDLSMFEAAVRRFEGSGLREDDPARRSTVGSFGEAMAAASRIVGRHPVAFV